MAAHLLLAGYFGSGNLGDDAILVAFAQSLGEGFDITVTSGAPEETYRNYGLRSIPRKDPKAINEAIANCDALVFPGGSIFQDVTSVRSVAYYSQLVKTAHKAGKKVFLLAQGVGPLNRFLGKRMAAAAFGMADVITVRDPGSVSALQALGIKGNVRTTADMAFLLQPGGDTEAQSFSVANMTTVGISPRPLGKETKNVSKLFAELCTLLFKNGLMPVLIEMDKNEDGPLIQEITKAQGGKIPDIRRLQVPQQAQQRIARMDSMIAMRLHGGILAATVGVPPFMVSYDPKTTAFAKMLDLPFAPSLQGLTAQRLFELFMSFQKDKERHRKTVERRREELANLARQNIDIVKQGLGQSVKS